MEVVNELEHESRRPHRSRNSNYQDIDWDDEMEDGRELSLKKNRQCQIGDPAGSNILSESNPLSSPNLNLDTEDAEEEKPKMTMKVTYQGFTIHDRCLCVVVEPWPPLRGGTRAPSAAPTSIHRFSSRGPPETSVIPLRRERTPLFLPEIDPRRSVTPTPLPSKILPPVPLFDDIFDDHGQEEENEEGGMLAFSQMLSSMHDERAGSADEDENEGDALLGDADERKGDL
jgi:hypothetical protein